MSCVYGVERVQQRVKQLHVQFFRQVDIIQLVANLQIRVFCCGNII